MKNYNIVFKVFRNLFFTFFALLIFGTVVFATDGTFGSPTLSLGDLSGCISTTYTFTQSIGNNGDLQIDVGNNVVITFPAGTDASTFTGGTFDGTAITGATATATQISFSSPEQVKKNNSFTIVLNGITNGGNISANCTLSSGNTSGGTNSGTYTLTTNACPCANISSFPWTEDFESTSTTLSCWSVNDNNSDSDEWTVQTSSTYANSGSQSYQIYTDFNSGSNDDYLISPAIVLTGNEQLRFYQRVRSSSEPNDFEVLLSTTGNAPANFSTTLLANTSYNNTTYQELTIDLSSYSGTVYIAIHIPNGGLDGYYLYIDDFTIEAIPSCPDPSSLAAGSILGTQAELSWTDNAGASLWDIELGTSGFSPTGTPTQSGVTNPYTYTGLSASTDYEYYVRADCGGGDYSTWVGPYSFTTACGAISALPWSENFDAVTTPDMPNCWAIEDNNAPDDDWETSSSYASSSPNSMFISWDGSNALDDWAFSPGFSLTSGISYRVEFVYRASSSSYNESLELFYGTGQSSGSMTVELFDDASFNHETFQTVTVDFTPSSTDTYYFGWHAYSIANQLGIYVDDVAVSITPSCPSPTNLSASSITATQADLSWTDNAGASLWDIELGTSGFSPTGTPTQFGVTNPYTYTGLSELTDYEYYVRADCGGGDYSEWVGPYSFSTPSSCPDPTALSAGSITATQAELSWTDNAGASLWDIELGASGFTPTGTPTQSGVTNPYTYTGLSETIDYEFYVRADCGGGDYSIWIGPYAFTTTQVPGTLTYTEDFESWPTGWSVVNGSEINLWEIGTATAASGSSSAYISNDGGTNNAYDIVETTVVHLYRDIEFPVSSNPFNLQFKWKGQGEGTAYDRMRVFMIAPSTIPTAGTELASGQIGATNYNLQGSWITENIQLDATTYEDNIWRLVFTWRNDGSSGAQPPIAIDDIEIKVITCPAPSALTASSTIPTEADLTWTESGSATQWDIEYGASGFTQGTGTTISGVTNNPYTLTGLTGSTDYDFYVRADCGGEQSIWSGPYSFTTAPPYMVYTSSTVTQNNINPVNRGSVNQEIICIEVVTTDPTSPLDITQFDLNTNGSTSPGTDILNAKLYYTGTTATFGTGTQFGANEANPIGNFSITGSQALAEGTNYFWLIYDINSSATLNDFVDAECTSITVDGSAETPTETAPTGERQILNVFLMSDPNTVSTCTGVFYDSGRL